MRHLGKTVLNGLLLGAAAGALTVGFASKSFAGALAFSTFEISNFQILKANGSQYDVGDFDVLEIGDFTKAEASLNGAGTVATHPSDVPQQCIGACGGIGENDFSRQGGPLGQFSRADAVLSGAGLSGVPDTPNSVTARSVAEVQLNEATGEGTAGSNLGTGSRFSFVPESDGSLTFRFDATPMLEALLEQPDIQAFASVAWSLSILDGAGNQVFAWAPDGLAGGILCNGGSEEANAGCTETTDPFSLNTSIATLDSGDGLVTYNPGTGTFEVTSPILLAGGNYTLSINQESAANASVSPAPQVPEPAAAALLGLGLLGLAGVRRRFQKA
jgi:hypothetical protein